MLFPIDRDNHDYYEWIRLHGLKIVDYKNQPCVRIEVPCKALKEKRCVIYQGRPSMCAISPCIKEDIVEQTGSGEQAGQDPLERDPRP